MLLLRFVVATLQQVSISYHNASHPSSSCAGVCDVSVSFPICLSITCRICMAHNQTTGLRLVPTRRSSMSFAGYDGLTWVSVMIGANASILCLVDLRPVHCRQPFRHTQFLPLVPVRRHQLHRLSLQRLKKLRINYNCNLDFPWIWETWYDSRACEHPALCVFVLPLCTILSKC